MWLWYVCGSGSTFRDAYASWSSKACAATASYHRIGAENLAHRKLSNDAFTMLLKTLRFPDDNDLFELFSCSTCENEDDDEAGSRYFDGVVMDGTALGILECLPEFVRNTQLISVVPGIPEGNQ